MAIDKRAAALLGFDLSPRARANIPLRSLLPEAGGQKPGAGCTISISFAMPELSRFYGLVIKMFFGASEHNPPHFHVTYGEHVGVIDMATLTMEEGDLPARAQALVREWASIHRAELMEIWNTQTFRKIEPLP